MQSYSNVPRDKKKCTVVYYPNKLKTMSKSATAVYREKIIARKCLNSLIDIRLGLLRQNRLLEILIEEARDEERTSAVQK